MSSDSEKILKYAKKNGALIIKRPKSLSSDTSSSEAAWLHAAEYVEKNGYKIDTIVGIQPTSPIRVSKDFDNALDIFHKKNLIVYFRQQL